MRTSLRTAAAGTVATMVMGGAVLAGTTGASANDGGRQLTGTWSVTVDPDAAPDGTDVPPFASTIAYTATGTVIEATSRAPMSAGLGTWERLGGGQFTSTVEKYRFTPTGAPAGSIRIVEVQTVAPDGETYTARATTTLLRPDGSVERSFGVTVTATRF